MRTAARIVELAFRRCGMLQVGEALEGEDLESGLEALNLMLGDWSLRGLIVGAPNLGANDNLPLPSQFDGGVVSVLAGWLSSDYVAPVGFDADDFFRNIQSALTEPVRLGFDAVLLDMPTQTSTAYLDDLENP